MELAHDNGLTRREGSPATATLEIGLKRCSTLAVCASAELVLRVDRKR